MYAVLNASPHQGRTCAFVGKGEDALQHMQRILSHLLAVTINDNIFILQRQISVLGGHKKRIEQLSHGTSSSAA